VSKGVNNPSVLVVQKLSGREARQAQDGILNMTYNIFMSTPRKEADLCLWSGWARVGR